MIHPNAIKFLLAATGLVASSILAIASMALAWPDIPLVRDLGCFGTYDIVVSYVLIPIQSYPLTFLSGAGVALGAVIIVALTGSLQGKPNDTQERETMSLTSKLIFQTKNGQNPLKRLTQQNADLQVLCAQRQSELEQLSEELSQLQYALRVMGLDPSKLAKWMADPTDQCLKCILLSAVDFSEEKLPTSAKAGLSGLEFLCTSTDTNGWRSMWESLKLKA